MILDAVLMTVGRIARNMDPHLEVAIFPEMRISTHEEVTLQNEGYEVALTGTVDYAVVQYKDEMQNKGGLPVRFIKTCFYVDSRTSTRRRRCEP